MTVSDDLDLGDDHVISRSGPHVSTRLDEDTVIMHLDTEEYFTLDPVATAIWEHLTDPRRFADLLDHLAERFDVSEADHRAGTETFVARMVDNGLLEVAAPAT